MKIAYFINQYPAISHSFIRREIQALERRGVEVRRFAIRPPEDAIFSAEDEDESRKTRHIVRAPLASLMRAMARRCALTPGRAARALASALGLGWRSESGLLRHVFYFGEALVLADWMRSEDIRHVHAHFGTNGALIAMLAARLVGAGYSLTVHGPEEFEKPALISLKTKIEHAAFTVGVCQFGAAQLKKLTSPDHWPRINIVRCGLERAFYADADAPPPSAPKFICVGRLCAEKGQVDLVDAVARLADERPDLRLTLIGDGPLRGAIEAAIARHGLEDAIELLGWRTPEDVRNAILASRAFVLPSYAEGLPVSIMEALALRRPVISTYVAGIPELVGEGVCGWLVPAGDAEAMANALRGAMNANDARIADMGAQGRRRVERMHNVDCEAEKLRALFASALEELG